MPTTISLQHLRGTTGTRQALLVRSVQGIIKGLKSHTAVTAAGPNGAINIWIDDEGLYRCEAMHYLNTIAVLGVKTILPVKMWAKEWLHKINL